MPGGQSAPWWHAAQASGVQRRSEGFSRRRGFARGTAGVLHANCTDGLGWCKCIPDRRRETWFYRRCCTARQSRRCSTCRIRRWMRMPTWKTGGRPRSELAASCTTSRNWMVRRAGRAALRCPTAKRLKKPNPQPKDVVEELRLPAPLRLDVRRDRHAPLRQLQNPARRPLPRRPAYPSRWRLQRRLQIRHPRPLPKRFVP